MEDIYTYIYIYDMTATSEMYSTGIALEKL